ncbi:MAG: hypothetical protein H7066_04060 [Cytophagaceae bacterium]|nr:hypothetical protein [Gemmatimonadaceae bacterium]
MDGIDGVDGVDEMDEIDEIDEMERTLVAPAKAGAQGRSPMLASNDTGHRLSPVLR